jgi:hypothetical protein
VAEVEGIAKIFDRTFLTGARVLVYGFYDVLTQQRRLRRRFGVFAAFAPQVARALRATVDDKEPPCDLSACRRGRREEGSHTAQIGVCVVAEMRSRQKTRFIDGPCPQPGRAGIATVALIKRG